MDRFLQVHHRRDMTLLQFILEGYEGLLTASTEDASAAIVKVSIMAGFHDDVVCILRSLRELIAFTEIISAPGEELQEHDDRKAVGYDCGITECKTR